MESLGNISKDIDMKPELKKLALDVLGAGALGKDFGLLQGRDGEYLLHLVYTDI